MDKSAVITYIGYIGGLGGEAVQTFDLAASVAALGVKTCLIVPNLPRLGPFAERYADAPNLEVVQTDAIRFDTGMQKPGDVWRTLGLRPAPILHLHTGDIALPRMTLLGLQAQKLLPKAPRAFATIHDAYPHMEPGSSRARFWAQVVNHRISGVVSPSRHGRDTQLSFGIQPERSVTIYNGIDVDRFSHGDGARVRAEFGIAPNVPLVVATGRLHPQKRPLDAVDAFARALKLVPTAQLLLVGGGPLEPETRARVAELKIEHQVQFVGHQSDIPAFLAASDVWLCTSDAENFSLSVLEALAAGCTIVGTWCRGNDEVLKEGENALTAPVGDTTALGNAIARALQQPDLRTRLSQSARQTAQSFRREDMARRHLALYGLSPVNTGQDTMKP